MKTILFSLAALLAAPAAAQTAPAKPGQSQHQPAPGGHEQDEHKGCCKMVDGRMECAMMKKMMDHGAKPGGQDQHQEHQPG